MRKLLGIALLCMAAIQLGYRGRQRVRSDVPLWDFVSVHSASRTWIQGGNPYDLTSVVTTWRTSGIFTERDVSYFATVYPPTSLLMIAPLAAMPAGPAMILWLMLTVALLVVQFLALAEMAGLRWRDSRMLILVAASLASAPFQFGILSGQLSLPAISLCIIAFWCAGKKHNKTGGVLLGLACALKVQIGAPFVLYYLILRRLSLAGCAILVAAVIGVIAIVGMHVSEINWIADWQRSVAATTQVGGVNDYGWAGEFRDEIVDLKMLLVSFIRHQMALRITILGITAALSLWYIRVFPGQEQRNPHAELLTLAGLSALSLLPVYHRVYDIALLTTLFAWALAELDGPRRRNALILFIPMLVFLVPFDFTRSIGRQIPHLFEASQTRGWQSFIAPHYAWGLLALTIGILLTMTYRFRVTSCNTSSGSATSKPGS